MNRVFKTVGINKIGRSVFDLSYEKKLTCDMGELIPSLVLECVPGDIFKLGCELIVRFQPLVAPILHRIDASIHLFFVPNRLLFDDWEKFITGDVDGDDTTTLPTWQPTDYAVNSLWDYMEFPIGVDPVGAYPVDFPKRAYNLIYNEYYRDETLITELDITAAEDVQLRAWEKDYFTSCLTTQQRGTAPALPLSGTTFADFTNAVSGTSATADVIINDSSDTLQGETNGAYNTDLLNALNKNEVDFASATTFDVSDLRLAFQIQKWQERNNRAGVRYKEFLLAHFGIAPRDERLQRPEYIGGMKMPIIISEVLQTSESGTTAQGNLAGHGITANKDFIGKYKVKEYGVLIGILSIMPKPDYQQGIDRNWLKSDRYDYFHPEFANLSEQGVIRAEIFADGNSGNNNTVFGFQGVYDELRTHRNKICGQMRSDAATSFDYWHVARDFSSAPTLNQTFIECDPRKDIFAAPSEPGLIVQIGNLIKAIRPLPFIANPGFIDH